MSLRFRFEGAPFQFRAPFGARTFSPLWTDLLQSFTPSVACIPAGKRRSTRRKIFAKSLAQSYLVLSDKLVCFNQKLYGLAANRFPGVLPFPCGTLIHHSRPRKGRLAKTAFLARRVIKSREKRGFARRWSSFMRANKVLSLTFNADIRQPKNLRFESQRAHPNHGCARFSYSLFIAFLY